MSDPAIQIEHVGKRYRIGRRERYTTARESLTRLASAPFRALAGGGKLDEDNSFWALKDVNFEVERGEVVGIIGRNGAGKSTLLKVLSQITEPTEGRVVLDGRVGSLLEVGTGFHPELTGRENIYLNGAILGMTRGEIARKFDEIVAFSEVEKFLDTPVKQYSSGMYTRLAFAVAANLEPEILIVDEVLAVGDAEFQKKCLGKMSDVAKGGRTVLFVSHNMAAIQNLCQRAVLLQGGRVHANGDVAEVVQQYFQSGSDAGTTLETREDRDNGRTVRFVDLSIAARDGEVAGIVSAAPFEVAVSVENLGPEREVELSVNLEGGEGSRVATLSNRFTLQSIRLPHGRSEWSCAVEGLPIRPDVYAVSLWAGVPNETLDYVERATLVEVHPSDLYKTGRLPGREHGFVLTRFSWGARHDA